MYGFWAHNCLVWPCRSIDPHDPMLTATWRRMDSMSNRVNVLGAAASVLTGAVISAAFVADKLMGPELGSQLFPWLHHPLTFNYTYRGLWGTLAVVAVLFGVSLATKPPEPDKVAQTTIHWSEKFEPFRGWSDWRLQWLGLALITVAIYYWLW